MEKQAIHGNTIDGRNDASVDMVNIPLYLQGFFLHVVWYRISEPSRVCFIKKIKTTHTVK